MKFFCWRRLARYFGSTSWLSNGWEMMGVCWIHVWFVYKFNGFYTSTINLFCNVCVCACMCVILCRLRICAFHFSLACLPLVHEMCANIRCCLLFASFDQQNEWNILISLAVNYSRNMQMLVMFINISHEWKKNFIKIVHYGNEPIEYRFEKKPRMRCFFEFHCCWLKLVPSTVGNENWIFKYRLSSNIDKMHIDIYAMHSSDMLHMLFPLDVRASVWFLL